MPYVMECICEREWVADVNILKTINRECHMHGAGTVYARFHLICEQIQAFMPDKRFSGPPPEIQFFEYVNKMKAFIQEFADEGCEYRDNCPRFVNLNHYECASCRARRLLLHGQEKQ